MKKALLLAAVAAALAWSLAPLAWQAATSLADPLSYAQIFQQRPFAVYLRNSVAVCLAATALCLALAAPAAYALSRKLPGGRWALAAVLGASLFPPTLLVVSLKRLAMQAGLLNSLPALAVAYAALNMPLAVWTLRSFFLEVPKEIEEAAQVDGLSRSATLLRVVLPLCAPAAATTAILVFISCWNEFLLALALLSRDEVRTVPVGIAMLSGVTVYEMPRAQIAAAVVVTTLPVAALVLLFQRRIVEGLTAGAVKG